MSTFIGLAILAPEIIVLSLFSQWITGHMAQARRANPRYHVEDVRTSLKEALGFLKDWVTAIIQIETALLGGIGAAAVLKDNPDIRLTLFQTCSLLFTALTFGLSILCGVMLLNMLPGAVQREPVNPDDLHDDIYSFTTAGRLRIVDWSRMFRWGFFCGLAGIVAFVVSRAVAPVL